MPIGKTCRAPGAGNAAELPASPPGTKIAANCRELSPSGDVADCDRLQDERVRKMRLVFGFCLISSLCAAATARADVRIKDIADVEGVRENQLVGYGLVVGLNGTGDKLNNNVF